ncbi:MAG: release factor glutamine methyltransferase [Ilumatobacter sp.]|jgi:release factor glutamine methyltransferase
MPSLPTTGPACWLKEAMMPGADPSRHERGTVTWRELLDETSELLAERTHARWICETATSSTPAEFTAMLNQPATERAVSHLDAMVSRARGGEPIQYVLGSWGFRHLDLAVDARVLIPRPETEGVAEIAIGLAAAAGPIRHVADLGTGSGAIGLAMADELPRDGTTVWITDTSPDALDVARSNLAGIGTAASNVRVAEGSWFAPLPTAVMFDLVVSNPPYVADASVDIEHIVSDWEPTSALFGGPDGLDDLRTIIVESPVWIRPGGWLVLEHGFDQGDSVRSLLTESGFVDIETRADLAGLDRCSLGRRPWFLFAAAHASGSIVVRHLRNQIGDYAHLRAWLTTPDVLQFYDGRDQTFDLSRILARYGPSGDLEREGTTPAIIELNGEPVGYLQLYELLDPVVAASFEITDGPGVWSMDLFLGQPDLFGTGIGRVVCRAAAEFLLDQRKARDVVIVPHADNARAIAAYRAAGFDGSHIVANREMHEGQMHDALRLHFQQR